MAILQYAAHQEVEDSQSSQSSIELKQCSCSGGLFALKALMLRDNMVEITSHANANFNAQRGYLFAIQTLLFKVLLFHLYTCTSL